jgi:predicted dehydrogenase
MGAPRVGVIGAGSLGFHHVRILSGMEGLSFAGFHEAGAERAAHVAGELGVRAFPTLDALLDSVDAVTIAVPTPAHAQVALAALERGIHTLIEKPIATTLEEADAMLAVAKRTGAIVQTGHVERFNRAIRAAIPYVDNPRFIQIDRLAPFNPRGSDVAVVLDLMIHDLDLVGSLVKSVVAEVSSVGVPILTPFVDIANARIRFENGAVANVTSSRVSRDRMRKLRIFQQSGYLTLDLAAGTGAFFRMREGLNLAELTQAPLKLEEYVQLIPLDAPEGEPLRLEFQSFLDAITGKSPVVVSGEDGRNALAVALQIVSGIESELAVIQAASGSAGA